MIKCACGADNRDNARFCSMCGNPLPPSSQLATGTLLRGGRYRVHSLVGKGGMGAVYRAEDLSLFGKYWALKEFTDTFTNPADRAQAIQQFEQEARLLVSLSHRNLPHVTDYFAENGRQYLVMEYVDGDTLTALLQTAKGSIPEAQVVDWTGQLCDVLEYLHGQKPKPVVFRDLKPSNIMLARSGEIKLIDFGIARLFDVTKRTDTLKMGTAGYAPPEQYAGHGQTDARSDIYALGATVHHLLTGRDPSMQPFIFPACRTLKANISPAMEGVVTRAVQLDPTQRFQTTRELRNALPGAGSPSAPAAKATAQPPAAAAPTVAAPALGVKLLGTGPTDVKLTDMTLTATFTAYCGQDRRETQWVVEGNGDRSCLECGRAVPVSGAGAHFKAWCSRCGQITLRAWSVSKQVCLGCGQGFTVGAFKQQMRAWCLSCKQQTDWLCSDKETVCLGCGRSFSVSQLKNLVSEYKSSNAITQRTWTVERGLEAFCSKCGCKTPWLVWQVRYSTGTSYYNWSNQSVRQCLWCGDQR